MGGVELVVTLHGRGRACPARRFAWADFCGWLPGGWPLAQGFPGRRGRRPLRFARERAAAGACPSSGPAGPPSPEGEGKGCSGGIHPSRGVSGSGRPRRGGGTPPYGWGYGNAVGFTWAPVSGPPHGRGRACPARGFSRGWAAAEGFRGVGDAAPYAGGCPLTGCRANLRRGVGTPPYGWNSRKRGRGGLYAAREFIRDAVRRLLFFFQHWAGHTVENVSSLPGMDV